MRYDALMNSLNMGKCRRPVFDWRSRLRGIFNQHQPAHKGTRLFAESLFPVGRPEIMRRTDGLFGAVVEIVPEGRADLAFQFDGRDQFAFVDHEKIP